MQSQPDQGSREDSTPLLSVAMSVYNGGDFLREAVLSVVRQTFCDWELLLIDDGSTDGAVDRLADITDTRIRVIRDGENHGLAARLNQAVSLARGKYFARMDQDDICHPERFERQLAYLAAHPETDLLGTKCVTINEAGEINGTLPFAADHENLCRRPWAGFYIPHPTWMGPLAWFQKHGYASPAPYFCEDQELLLRTHRKSHFHVLPEPLLAYRTPGRWRWGKRLRTRTTLLQVQIARFAECREYHFAFFSILATGARILSDFFAFVGLADRPGGQELQSPPEEDRLARFLAYYHSFIPRRDLESEVSGRMVDPRTQPADARRNHPPKLLLFWSLGFVYSCLLALAMQKLLLPMVPEMHAGHGLLKNDAIIFHEAAVALAGRIRESGWSEWVLYPTGFTGNVGILATLYACFGPEPAVFIPLNAAAHTTGALMLLMLGNLLWPGKQGRLGGLAAAIAFLAFPSALLWYGQNHKDAFAIAGTLMMLYAWLRLQRPVEPAGVVLRMFLLAATGVGLLAVVRTYFITIAAAAFACSWVASFCWLMISKNLKACASSIAITLVFVCLMFAVAAGTSKVSSARMAFDTVLTAAEMGGQSSSARMAFDTVLTAAEMGGQSSLEVLQWKWRETPGLPNQIDKMFRRVSELRVHFIRYAQSVGAGSGIDEHRIPSDVAGALAYLPRALFVGLFAPFPDSWSERVSLPRLAVAIETSVWYFFFLGLFVLAVRHPSRELLAGVAFSAVILVVLDYANPNVGTLYRLRYGVWMFLLLGGAVGWASLAIGFLARVERSHQTAHRIPGAQAETSGEESPGLNLSSLAASGALTMIITFVCYLGFLARDLLLVHANGLSTSMDSLFSAMMLPMVFVNCLSIPISDAITMPFVRLWNKSYTVDGKIFIRKVLFWAVLIMGASAVAAFLFAAPAIRMILGSENPRQIADGVTLMRLFTPIVLLSAWTVVGNSVLNALHRFQDSVLAQLAVPACSIVAILLAPPSLLPLYAILGMVVGTLANAVIVAILCLRQGVALWPSPAGCPDDTRPLFYSYGWLVFAALFTAATSPVNYYFAGLAGEGGVSGWALSSKMILLFNGLVVTAVTTVLLPHMARTIEWSTRPQTGSYFVFLLLGGTWAGGLVLLGVAAFSEPVVAALMGGGQVSESQIQVLSRVLRIGVIQLPVLVVAAMTLKAAAVTQRSSRTVLASAVALAVSCAISWLLVPMLGILGIAYASLGATIVGTLYLVFAMAKQCGLNRSIPWILLVTWTAWGWASFAITSSKWTYISGALAGILGLGLLHVFAWRKSLSKTSEEAP